MKYKFNKMIYEIAMNELLINNNDSTDLGKYMLEYITGYSDINSGDFGSGDAALAVGVRLLDKKSGEVYYKTLIKDKLCSNATEELSSMVDNLYLSSIEEKLEFITRPETITKKEFKSYYLVDPYLAEFMGNLNHPDYMVEIDSAVSLNGRFPKDSLLVVNDIYKSLNETRQNQMKL